MKLKRLFAGILAVAMMATMAAPAFATSGSTSPSGGNTGSGDTSSSGTVSESYTDALSENDAKTLSLTKILEVAKGTAPDKMTFNFNVYKVENGTPSTSVSTTKSVNFNINDESRSAQDAFNTTNCDSGLSAGEYKESFTLNIPELLGSTAKVGTYTYKIVEQNNNYQSVVPEWTAVYMTVTKVNDSNNEGAYKYYVALHKADASGKKIQGTEAFKNVYGGKEGEKDNVNTLTLSKTVHGNLGDLTQTFQFKVKFTRNNTTTIQDRDYKGPQVEWTGTDAAIVSGGTTGGATSGKSINNGSYLSLNTEYVVTLGHKKSISFENLPDGINYEITELGDNDANGSTTSVGTDGKVTVGGVSYTVTVNNTTNDAGTAAVVKGAIKKSMNGADVTEAFHNTNEASIDTGVILDNAPYIALLLIAAAGAVVMVVKKRRHED